MNHHMFTTNRILVLIVLLGVLLRIYGLNWDQGYHLHPDERAIIMAVVQLEFPKTISDFLSPETVEAYW